VPLKKLFLMNSQMLHELLVFNLLPTLVITLDLILQFFHTIALASIFLKFFSSEVVAIKKLLFKESD